MKKLISLLLAMILVCSMLPMSAMAIKLPDFSDLPVIEGKPDLTTKEEEHKSELPALNPSGMGKADSEKIPYHPSINDHSDLGWEFNTKYHWMECACGARLGVELHVDPLDTENDYCECGYHFSSNADLVTLWIKGCPGIKNFRKDQTEYTLNTYTYKDVKEIKISTRTHDSEATVELPEDLTLKEGENKFEIKVTAENKKNTKVYTVIINKEAK